MLADQILSDRFVSILERAILNTGKPMDPVAAKEFLRWQLSSQDDGRLDKLTAKSKQQGLTEDEADEVEAICSTIDFLSMLHIHAREALGEAPSAGA